MNEPTNAPSKDDPLQRFMVIAAVALLAMMAIEEFRIHRVTSAAQHLRGFDQSVLAPKGCTATSAGLSGAAWIIDCPDQAPELSVKWLEPLVVAHGGFDRVFVGDRKDFLVCAADITPWGKETCEIAIRPSDVVDAEKIPKP
jgi:hypothetical protein